MAGTEAVMVGLYAFVWFWGLVEERWALSIWCTIHRNLPGSCWYLHYPNDMPGPWEPAETPQVGGVRVVE